MTFPPVPVVLPPLGLVLEVFFHCDPFSEDDTLPFTVGDVGVWTCGVGVTLGGGIWTVGTLTSIAAAGAAIPHATRRILATAIFGFKCSHSLRGCSPSAVPCRQRGDHPSGTVFAALHEAVRGPSRHLLQCSDS